MRTGRPIPPLTLTGDERDTLERWARRPTTARALAERARLVLECAAGKTNTVVARELRLTKQTIGKWRTRFLGQRLEGLLDEPRPGAPRRITDDDVERVMRVTLETTPRDATHWSTRTLARRCGLSQTAVSRIWRAFSLNVLTRCGRRLNARQIRLTAVWLSPHRRASVRVLQCVASRGVVSSVTRITRSTSASVIRRGAPGRGSSSNP